MLTCQRSDEDELLCWIPPLPLRQRVVGDCARVSEEERVRCDVKMTVPWICLQKQPRSRLGGWRIMRHATDFMPRGLVTPTIGHWGGQH